MHVAYIQNDGNKSNCWNSTTYQQAVTFHSPAMVRIALLTLIYCQIC